jgi:hypothetical protein
VLLLLLEQLLLHRLHFQHFDELVKLHVQVILHHQHPVSIKYSSSKKTTSIQINKLHDKH